MKKTVLVLLLAGVCWGGALQAKDWKNEQLAQVQQAARQGDAAAQRKLGLMHEAGRGEGQAQVSAGKTDANAQAERFLMIIQSLPIH